MPTNEEVLFRNVFTIFEVPFARPVSPVQKLIKLLEWLGKLNELELWPKFAHRQLAGGNGVSKVPSHKRPLWAWKERSVHTKQNTVTNECLKTALRPRSLRQGNYHSFNIAPVNAFETGALSKLIHITVKRPNSRLLLYSRMEPITGNERSSHICLQRSAEPDPPAHSPLSALGVYKEVGKTCQARNARMVNKQNLKKGLAHHTSGKLIMDGTPSNSKYIHTA